MKPLVPRSSLAFVSKAGVDSGAVESYHLQKRVEIVKGCRKISKRDMKFNSALPEMKVDPELWVGVLPRLVESISESREVG